ncbi:MAG: S8 family serine peptidase, partial [Candidatus Eremiobacteraeota bacterium]|nr:S8 family serine peptidase [Candidatus Eremiobacteraeota bacterium]
SYLLRNGFTNVHVTPDNLLVTADGTARSGRAAFGTNEHLRMAEGRRFYANAEAPRLPAALGKTVLSVLGLDSYGMHAMHRFAVRKATAPNCTPIPTTTLCVLNEYNPIGFQQAYDVGSTVTGSKSSIAIFAEGALSQVVTDLRTQEKASGLTQVPVYVIPTGVPSTDTSGEDEWDLDSQYSTGIAGKVDKLILYDAPSLSDGDTSIEFDRFKTDDVVQAGSASFGECEIFPDTDGALLTDDIIFSEAAAQGQTVFASAGDTGAACPAPIVSMNGVPAGLPFQEYPASSTYVVAVGGTTLITNTAGAYSAEIGWYSGGGGPSLIETPGTWQTGVASSVITAVGARSVPDIAMDADPDTGASVIVAGTAEEVGGTSLSSPLALGVWARLESANNNKLGFASPLFYKEYKDLVTTGDKVPKAGALVQTIGGFHDEFLGANPLPAEPEYDFSTGLGSLDVALQASDILK